LVRAFASAKLGAPAAVRLLSEERADEIGSEADLEAVRERRLAVDALGPHQVDHHLEALEDRVGEALLHRAHQVVVARARCQHHGQPPKQWMD
jgi:hypothetical protein